MVRKVNTNKVREGERFKVNAEISDINRLDIAMEWDDPDDDINMKWDA